MNICKKIISTICSSVFAFSCFGFNASAEEDTSIENIKAVFVNNWRNWYVDLHNIPFTEVNFISELIFEDAYTYTYKIIANEDVDLFMFWQRSEKKTNVSSGPSGQTDEVSFALPIFLPSIEKYNSNGKLNTLYIDNINVMYGFSSTSSSHINNKSYQYFTQSSRNFATNRPFVYAGDVIYECKIHVQTADFPILDYQSINYVKEKLMPMKVDTTNATLLDVEAENMRIREEANSYKAMDFDEDGLLTNADAQMILVYYTDSLVGKTTGKVEDYSEYVKQISG